MGVSDFFPGKVWISKPRKSLDFVTSYFVPQIFLSPLSWIRVQPWPISNPDHSNLSVHIGLKNRIADLYYTQRLKMNRQSCVIKISENFNITKYLVLLGLFTLFRTTFCDLVRNKEFRETFLYPADELNYFYILLKLSRVACEFRRDQMDHLSSGVSAQIEIFKIFRSLIRMGRLCYLFRCVDHKNLSLCTPERSWNKQCRLWK